MKECQGLARQILGAAGAPSWCKPSLPEQFHTEGLVGVHLFEFLAPALRQGTLCEAALLELGIRLTLPADVASKTSLEDAKSKISTTWIRASSAWSSFSKAVAVAVRESKQASLNKWKLMYQGSDSETTFDDDFSTQPQIDLMDKLQQIEQTLKNNLRKGCRKTWVSLNDFVVPGAQGPRASSTSWVSIAILGARKR